MTIDISSSSVEITQTHTVTVTTKDPVYTLCKAFGALPQSTYLTAVDRENDTFKMLLHSSRGSQPSTYGMSDRELEIVKHVCSGIGRKQVALKLGVTIRTIQTHLSNAFAKAGVHTVLELLILLLREGLVTAAEIESLRQGDKLHRAT